MQITIVKELESTKFTLLRFVEGTDTELIRDNDIRVLHLGIGKKAELNRRKYLRLLRRSIQEAKSRKLTDISYDWHDLNLKKLKTSPSELGELIAANFSVANYEFDSFKTSDKDKIRIKNVQIVKAPAAIRRGLEKGLTIAHEMNKARALANMPGGSMTPDILAKAAVKAAVGTNVKVTVLDQAQIRKLKMGALLGVAKGSVVPPRFIIMEYYGASKKIKPVILVGKGVTFDTGGINLKPTAAMDGMHMDMSGGAMVMHAVIAAAKLKLKKNIISLIPAVENMPSGSSYRPGDILKSMSGKTIEIGNTDAEGRVILADALTYAEKYDPRIIIDVATLTGASAVALGLRASAIFSNRESLLSKAQKAGDYTGEYVWPLPLWEEYDLDFKADFADVRNDHKGRYGGTMIAARFLYQFIQDRSWLHIDMAPRMVSTEGDYLAKGSTGEPLRLLVKLLEQL